MFKETEYHDLDPFSAPAGTASTASNSRLDQGPMLDVILILLVFLITLVTSVVLNTDEESHKISVVLPKVSVDGRKGTRPSRDPSTAQIVVAITEGGRISVDNETVEFSGLQENLAKYDQTTTRVILDGFAGASWQEIAKVLNVIEQVGFLRLDLNTKPGKSIERRK